MTGLADTTDPADTPALPRWNLWIAAALYLAWIVLYHATPAMELGHGVRAWYPPVALLAAACIVWGGWGLVPVILGSITIALSIGTGSESLWRYLAVSVLAKLLYWLGSRVLRALHFDPRFSRPSDVARFGLTFAAVAAAAALLGVSNMRDFGSLADRDSLRMLRGFWIGDLMAVLALTPAFLAGCLALAHWHPALPRRPSRRAIAQLISVPASIALAALLAPGLGFFAYAVCLLPLGWIALEHGTRLAAATTAFTSFSAILILQRSAAPSSGLELQAFIGLLAVTGLLIGSVADDRQRALELLHQSEERYRSLVELLPDPLVVHEEGRVLFANGAAVGVFGARSTAELEGKHLADLADPVSRELVQQRIGLLAHGIGVTMAQHTMRRLDGAGVVELESVSTPFTFHGRSAALTVARDVTRRVRLELELRHAQRMEAVGRLAGGIAHDFNNLLTVITSYSELLLADARHDESLRRDVREILHAANRASAMTRQLLSFSRRQVLAPAPLDVNEVVAGMEALLRRLIGPEIAILSRLDPTVGIVLADKGQLEQVIVNLAVNARDAMPDGGVLAIETANVEPADDPATARCSPAERYAAIIVRDTGAGIDPETLRRIFDPFFTTKEVGQGTGLGLATVHGIVEQSGGAVAVESHLGAGSAFRILLPALPTATSAPAAAPAPAPEKHAGHGLVLLVEDDDSVREGVSRMLRAAGYQVLEARDGFGAMELLGIRDGQVDLVLTDIAMPKMNGHVLASEIRQRWAALPVILTAAFADPAELRTHAAGFAVLQKPFEMEALASAIGAALGRRQLRAEPS